MTVVKSDVKINDYIEFSQTDAATFSILYKTA